MSLFISARRTLCLAALTLLSACTTTPPCLCAGANPPPLDATASPGRLDAALGKRAYDEGDYRTALRYLQNALSGELPTADKVGVHKYLAFMACAQTRVDVCRGHFRSAFDLNAQFSLTPTEAGHPLWDPIFKEVVAEIAKRDRRK